MAVNFDYHEQINKVMGNDFNSGLPARGEEFPLQEDYPIKESNTYPFYPPVCLREHWDRSAIIRHVVPSQLVPLPMDFRPYTKVCKRYVTSAPAQPAPAPPADMVFPPGGEFYPPTRYSAAINDESVLRRLDQPLRKYCDEGQYLPHLEGDMYSTAPMAPKGRKSNSSMVQELAMPQVCLKAGEYECRAGADRVNWQRSPRLFNNPTKQDRYPAQPRNGAVPIMPPKDSALGSDGVTRSVSGPLPPATKEQDRVWGP